VDDIVGGMEGVTAVDGSAEEDSEDGVDGGGEDSAERPSGAEVLGSGEVFVGDLFTKSVISSGVFAGVTLSMNWKAGRRRTVVLWSE
jgi:hypothetical protein